jgi:hypothetical protein
MTGPTRRSLLGAALGSTALGPTALGPTAWRPPSVRGVDDVGSSAAAAPPGRNRPRGRADLVAVGLYLLGAVYLAERLWRHLHTFALSLNGTDQIQVEYFAEHAVRVVTRGENPFFLTQLNAPAGVNLMANTATLGLHLPLVPVTMLFGADVTFAVELTVSLAGTAAAWYWLFSRHLVASRFAAFVGAGFIAFAPGMISHANGHPNIIAQFLIPFILWYLVRLREVDHRWRTRIVLALLVVYQMLINEEILFAYGLATVVFLVVWAIAHRAEARAAAGPFLRGLTITGGIVLVLMAYPLFVQFFGAQSYHGLWPDAARFGNDLLSFTNFAQQSSSGDLGTVRRLAANPTEQNAFFGWPLLVLFAYLVVRYRRRTVLRAMAIAGAVLAVLSLGPHLRVDGVHTSIPAPYRLLSGLPIFDSVITGRLVLIALPAIGALLAVFLNDEWDPGARSATPAHRFTPRLVATAAVVAALLPLAPSPLPTVNRTPVPAFFANGEWRAYVPSGRTIVAVPVPSLSDTMDGMQWAVATHLDFTQPGGYFLGPTTTGVGYFGPPPRPTDVLLRAENRLGRAPVITTREQTDARADLRYWRAAILVLRANRRHAELLRDTVTQLLGVTPELVDGVWLWDVRALTP